MFRSKRLFAFLVLTLRAVLFENSTARAQEPQKVVVSFTFRAPEFIGNLGDAPRTGMEARISASLAQILGRPNRFPYWSFQAGPSNALPRLSVWVEFVHPDWEVRMVLVTDQGETGEPLGGRLYAPADLELSKGLPDSTTWEESIRLALDEHLLAEQKQKIFKDLTESVPLGQKVAPAGPMPPPSAQMARGVLPLNWSKHCRLARSEFRVVCSWAQGGEVTLHSVGIVMPFPYNSSFQGIIVQYRNWEFGGLQESISQHLQDLPQLTPLFFYLEKLNAFSRPCSAAEGSGLSVAP
jgi:hypothetical protein